MRVSKFLKYVFIVTALLSQLFNLVKSHGAKVNRLPEGCKDYEVISGDPQTATILLFGEAHHMCSSSAKCMNALAKQRGDTAEDSIALYEFAPYNTKAECSPNLFATECYGSNKPDKERSAFSNAVRHGMLLMDLLNLHSKTSIFGFIQYQTTQNQQRLAKLNKKQHAFSRQSKFYSRDQYEMNYMHSENAYLDRLKTKIKTQKLSFDAIHKMIEAEFTKVNKKVHELDKNDAQLKSANNFLHTSIKQARKKKRNVYVEGGNAHFLPDSTKSKAAKELMQKLAADSDQNPVAVLSCGPKRMY